MAMFLAEISFLLALALFAAGLVVWQQGRQASAGLLRTAGAVLVVGAALTALCTGYFSVRYQVQGEFDHAQPFHHAWAARGMPGPGCCAECPRGMGPGSMGPGMMGPRMMGPGMMQSGTPAAQAEPPAHEEHHPGSEPPDR